MQPHSIQMIGAAFVLGFGAGIIAREREIKRANKKLSDLAEATRLLATKVKDHDLPITAFENIVLHTIADELNLNN